MVPGSKALVQSLILTPPRAYGTAGPFGQIVVIAVTTAAVYLDLRSLTFGLEYSPYASINNAGNGAPPAGPVGAVGSYVCIYADQCDLGVILGPTAASVSGPNAPILNNVGSLGSNGIYLGAAGTCYRIPSTAFNEEPRWRLQVGQDNFVGIVGSANGFARIYVSSEAGLQS
jgi:hypothetical protein